MGPLCSLQGGKILGYAVYSDGLALDQFAFAAVSVGGVLQRLHVLLVRSRSEVVHHTVDRVFVVDGLGGAAQFADHPLDALLGSEDFRVDSGDAAAESLHGIGRFHIFFRFFETVKIALLTAKAKGLRRAKLPTATRGTAKAAAI